MNNTADASHRRRPFITDRPGRMTRDLVDSPKVHHFTGLHHGYISTQRRSSYVRGVSKELPNTSRSKSRTGTDDIFHLVRASVSHGIRTSVFHQIGTSERPADLRSRSANSQLYSQLGSKIPKPPLRMPNQRSEPGSMKKLLGGQSRKPNFCSSQYIR